MHGRASAPAAGTIVNALATGTGAAFAIDARVTAEVSLDDGGDVDGAVAGHPEADTRLVERCVELVVARFGDGEGGEVHTDAEVPMASGLKSSSAAANATVLAALDALDVPVSGSETGAVVDGSEVDGGGADGDAAVIDRLDAARIGVDAARDAGVTVTGAFDDASASMLGGVAVTDNDADELLTHEPFETHALLWIPPEEAHSADADVERCRRVAPVAAIAAELALEGRYGEAMTVNGLAYCAALLYPTEPVLEALPAVDGVSLSGTGPSYVAVGDREVLTAVRERWAVRPGETRLVETDDRGAVVG